MKIHRYIHLHVHVVRNENSTEDVDSKLLLAVLIQKEKFFYLSYTNIISKL